MLNEVLAAYGKHDAGQPWVSSFLDTPTRLVANDASWVIVDPKQPWKSGAKFSRYVDEKPSFYSQNGYVAVNFDAPPQTAYFVDCVMPETPKFHFIAVRWVAGSDNDEYVGEGKNVSVVNGHAVFGFSAGGGGRITVGIQGTDDNWELRQCELTPVQ